MAVKSSFRDEQINEDVDEENAVEMQPSILIRELLLVLFSAHMLLVYPGSDGTFSERVLAKLLNYVSGRGLEDASSNRRYSIEAPWHPIVIVDWGTGEGEGFFAGIDARIQARVEEFDLGKVSGKAAPSYHYVNTTDPVAAAREIVSILSRFMMDANLIHHSRLYPQEH